MPYSTPHAINTKRNRTIFMAGYTKQSRVAGITFMGIVVLALATDAPDWILIPAFGLAMFIGWLSEQD